MRPSRELIVLPILLALAALAWFVLQVRAERAVAVDRVAHEDRALEAVERVAAAEARHHERTGTYGWLEELRRAGDLEGLALREDGGALSVVTSGYRIDVMLPGPRSGGQTITLATRGDGVLSERLRRTHFAVIARPRGGARGGWRTLYLDERGRVYVNEGVSDPSTRADPPLPLARPLDHGGVDGNGLRWWPLDDLPLR